MGSVKFFFGFVGAAFLLFVVIISLSFSTSLKSQQVHKGYMNYSEKELIKSGREIQGETKFRNIPMRETKLKLKFSFPSEDLEKKDIYLWNPSRITINQKGEVFITDTDWDHIFKFDTKGNYIRTIGQKGQGPGEFRNPIGLYMTKKHIIVSDTNNNNIQFFDFDGNFLKGIKVYKTYIEIAVNDETGQIFAAPLIITPVTPLIDVLDRDGKLLYSFLKPPFKTAEDWNIANMIKLVINNRGEILVAFVNFPLVRKYSQSGELLKEWNIENDYMIKKGQSNLKSFSEDKNISGFQIVVYSLKPSKTGFYLLLNYPITQILEFNEEGKQINDFWIKETNDSKISDFFINDFFNGGKDEKEIYLIQKNPEAKILVMHTQY